MREIGFIVNDLKGGKIDHCVEDSGKQISLQHLKGLCKIQSELSKEGICCLWKPRIPHHWRVQTLFG